MTVYMIIATGAWIFFVVGFLVRRVFRLHVFFMLAAILSDISLVLYLEFTRDAINTAFSLTLNPLQQLHIGFSTLALLLYFPTVYCGWKMLQHGLDSRYRIFHFRFGVSALLFRTVGFFFMFSLIGR